MRLFPAEDGGPLAQDPAPRLWQSVDAGVAHLAFHHPRRRNAITVAMFEALAEALPTLAADPSVRVLVISGSGPGAFSSGGDMTEFGERRQTAEQQGTYRAMVHGVEAALAGFPRPTIAAISGPCMAAGLALALACDLRLAAPAARFAVPSARLGGGYGLHQIRQLSTLIGPARTKEMLYSAAPLDGVRAAAVGLANDCIDAAAFAETVAARAAVIAANAPLSLAAFKQAVDHLAAGGSDDDPDVIARLQACALSEDHREGQRAFAQKRPPVFQGR